jgi:hydroxymethylpyrimidine pyrophosphatase-like HAD family hydrolase
MFHGESRAHQNIGYIWYSMAELLPNSGTNDVQFLKKFGKIRLIVFDLDGSLIEHGASEPFHNIIRLGQNLRHYRYKVRITIATGRTLTGAKPLIELLSIPKRIPLILYNGSLVIKNGSFDIISKRSFLQGTLQNILDIALNYQVYVLAYYINGPIIPFLNDSYEYILGWSNGRRPEHDFNSIPIQWQQDYVFPADNFPSAILVDTADDPLSKPIIETQLINLPDISITKSGVSNYIEIRPAGSNKGAALEDVSKDIGLHQNEVLALGDNDNDIEMLAWAGIGVAIGHASLGAISNSDFVCKFDAAHGAIEVLRLVKHARYYFFKP